jgi:hypothetical protein
MTNPPQDVEASLDALPEEARARMDEIDSR